jgi:hypothetical protein
MSEKYFKKTIISLSVILFMLLCIVFIPILFEKLLYLIANDWLCIGIKRLYFGTGFSGFLRTWLYGFFLVFCSVMFVGLSIWFICLLDLLRLGIISVYSYMYDIIEEALK